MLSSVFAFSLKRNVPGTYASIQLALNACVQGDTVLVQPGTYTENLYWPKIQNIKLFSAGDSSNTIIDANFVGRCLTIIDSTKTLIDSNSVVSGFKLKNGFSDTTTFNGVAIYAYGTWPVLKNLAITNCNVNAVNSNTTNTLNGGVLYLEDAKISLRYSSVYNNKVYNSLGNIYGGIIAMNNYGSVIFNGCLYELKIFNNEINIKVLNTANNIKGAIMRGMLIINKLSVTNNNVNYFGSTTYSDFSGLFNSSFKFLSITGVLIANNTFSANTNIKINSLVINAPTSGSGAGAVLYNLTIADNKAITTGSINSISFYGIPGYVGSFTNYRLNNCIFWNPFNVSAIEVTTSGGYQMFDMFNCDVRTFSNITPNASTTLSPQFISGSDFHLQLTSPGIANGIVYYGMPSSDLDGSPMPMPLGSLPDMGCYEMNQPMGALTVSASISNTVLCYPSVICLYNYTPKTKISYVNIVPGALFFPFKDSICLNLTSGNYTINVCVTDSANAVGTSSFAVTVSLCTNIQSLTNNPPIEIFPNPNNGEFEINYKRTNENCFYEIYNCIGQIIKSGNLENEKTFINLKNQSSGIYIIKIFEDRRPLVVKRIVVD